MSRAIHQQTAGAAIEAMHDAQPVPRLRIVLHIGQFGIAPQQRIDQRTRFVAGARMHHHACRFVDDCQMLVLIYDFERDVFRLYRCLCPRRQPNHDYFIAFESVAAFLRDPVNKDAAAAD